MNFYISPYSDDVIYWGNDSDHYDADTGCGDFKFTLPSGEEIKLRVEYTEGGWEHNFEFPEGTNVDVDVDKNEKI